MNEENKVIENAVETYPEEAKQAAQEVGATALQNEAEQVGDGDKRTDEVSNKAVEQTVDLGIGDDFFANFANKIKAEKDYTDEEKKALGFGSAYATPKISKADHNAWRKGLISDDEYRKQLEQSKKDGQNALKKASDMMLEERERSENEGLPFNRARAGAYAFPGGRAVSVADKKLAELNDPNNVINENFISRYNRDIVPAMTKEMEANGENEDPNEMLDKLVNWANVSMPKPGEDPYMRAQEADYDPRIEANNNFDYPTGVGEPGVGKTVPSDKQVDEDFLGPDEYIDENGNIQVDPNWKPENADEDFLGPDEVPDEIPNMSSTLPEGQNDAAYSVSDQMLNDDHKGVAANYGEMPEISLSPIGGRSLDLGSATPFIEEQMAKTGPIKWDDAKSILQSINGAGKNIVGTSTINGIQTDDFNPEVSNPSYNTTGEMTQTPETGKATSSGPINGDTMKMFNDIMKNGMPLQTGDNNSHSSKFTSSLATKGKKNKENAVSQRPLKLNGGNGVSGNTAETLYDRINNYVMKNYMKWPDHEKNVGSISVSVEDKDVTIKYGSRRRIQLSTFAKEQPQNLKTVYAAICQ